MMVGLERRLVLKYLIHVPVLSSLKFYVLCIPKKNIGVDKFPLAA
jgi:hypothetical protein